MVAEQPLPDWHCRWAVENQRDLDGEKKMRHNTVKLRWVLLFAFPALPYLLAASAVNPSDIYRSPTQTSAQSDPNVIVVDLQPMLPDDKQFMKWYPAGNKLPLTVNQDRLEAKLLLGTAETPPVLLRLEREPQQDKYTLLRIDTNRNGLFDEDAVIKTSGSFSQSKNLTYYTFKTVLNVAVKDPTSGQATTNPYPISIWYTESGTSALPPTQLLWQYRGWMMGRTVVGADRAIVLLADSKMDGVFDQADRWAMVAPNQIQDIYLSESAHSVSDSIGLGKKAYRIAQVHPSGRRITLVSVDVDTLKTTNKDKPQPTGRPRSIVFAKDFARAKDLAEKQKKPLLLYFTMKNCGYCKKMEQGVFIDETVIAAAANTIPVKVELEKSRNLVKFFGVKGYPTFFLLSPDGTVIKQEVGYQTVEEMKALLAAGLPQDKP